ncbi:MAG TPA: VWA domain-containing protein [Planctomycetes bacterium]|nr:VWA domain-containing protein [Planctomycetota bacterium]
MISIPPWMTDLVWSTPLVFWLVIPLFGWVLVWRRRKTIEAAIPFAPMELSRRDPALRMTWRRRAVGLLNPLFAVGVLLLIAAAAGPAAPRAIPQTVRGVDMELCLDVSSSMATKDEGTTSSRLDVARTAALSFLERRVKDSVGLVAFARFPDLICPPTLDHTALAVALHELQPLAPDHPEDASAIGAALAAAVDSLGATSSTTPVVVLVTDGRENVATAGRPGEIAPIHAGQLAADLGVRVYIITTGAGADARDLGALEEVATMTGGDLFRAGDLAAMLQAFHEIDALERRPSRSPRWVMEDRSLPFLWAAVLVLVVVALLRAGPLEVLP